MIKFIIPLLLTLTFFCANAEEVKEPKKSLTAVDINALAILDGSEEHTIELLKELQNWESYRPSSFSDATRNPFQRQRYKFFDSEE
jgi:hypothetical protein|tara:strand:+ start:595 stop:852 length:258 start_codon:yes stop_codon:yes gene_type:complete